MRFIQETRACASLACADDLAVSDSGFPSASVYPCAVSEQRLALMGSESGSGFARSYLAVNNCRWRVKIWLIRSESVIFCHP